MLMNLFNDDNYSFDSFDLSSFNTYKYNKIYNDNIVKNENSFLNYNPDEIKNIFEYKEYKDFIESPQNTISYMDFYYLKKDDTIKKTKTTFFSEEKFEDNFLKFISEQKTDNKPIPDFLNKKTNHAHKKKNKFIHDKYGKDNLRRKIQVHFLNFCVNFVNYQLKKILNETNNLNFTILSYDFKQNVNKIFFKKLKNMSLRDILKNKGIKKNLNDNQKTLDIIMNLHNEEIDKLLDLKYIILFQEVYALSIYKNKSELTINYKVPKEIEKFDDLLLGELKKDPINGKVYVEKLHNVCRTEYIR